MKKSLLALAVLGAFAGAASAQSSVTLYGIVDVGYSFIDHERDGISSISGIDPGLQSGNRLGFRGSEALGRGLNAIFQIEAGFNLDTGASGQSSAAVPGFPGTGVSNRLFGRIALAGLQGDFGTLALGRFGTVGSGTGPFDLFGQIDPFGTGFTGAGGLQDTFTELNSLRTDNTIHYQSPKIAGFQGGIGYSFQVDGVEQAGSSNNSRAADAGLSWGAGPFYAAVTYSQIEFANQVVSFPDQKILQVGGTFDLKFVKLHAAYAKEEGIRNTVIASPLRRHRHCGPERRRRRLLDGRRHRAARRVQLLRVLPGTRRRRGRRFRSRWPGVRCRRHLRAVEADQPVRWPGAFGRATGRCPKERQTQASHQPVLRSATPSTGCDSWSACGTSSDRRLANQRPPTGGLFYSAAIGVPGRATARRRRRDLTSASLRACVNFRQCAASRASASGDAAISST